MPIYTLYQNLFISHGRSDVNMWLNIGQIMLQLIVILLFYREGITTMVVAYTLFNIFWLAAWQPFARRIIGLRTVDLLRDVLPFMLIAAAVMLVTHFVTQWAIVNYQLSIINYQLLLVRILLAAALYYAAMRLLHVAILQECMQFIKSKKVKE